MADFRLVSTPMADASRAVEIKLTGDITSANILRFQQEVTGILKQGVVIPVFLMHDAGFISSAGFAYLVEVVASLERHGGIVVMVDPQPKIRLIMETLGIAPLFTICPDLPAATKATKEHVEKLLKSPRLVEVLGTKEGIEYPLLNDKIRIGSDPQSTIVLKHNQVERHHAEVYRTGEQCFIKDLGTRFGTYVGKKKITESPLAKGDVITIATFRYAFVPPAKPKA